MRKTIIIPFQCKTFGGKGSSFTLFRINFDMAFDNSLIFTCTFYCQGFIEGEGLS